MPSGRILRHGMALTTGTSSENGGNRPSQVQFQRGRLHGGGGAGRRVVTTALRGLAVLGRSGTKSPGGCMSAPASQRGSGKALTWQLRHAGRCPRGLAPSSPRPKRVSTDAAFPRAHRGVELVVPSGALGRTRTTPAAGNCQADVTLLSPALCPRPLEPSELPH